MEAIRLRDLGYTQQRIAGSLQVNKSTVCRWLK